MTFKNIRISKRGGGTRLQRVKVLASGKYKFVKNLSKGAKRVTKRSRKSNPKRRTRKVTRKKRRRGGKSLQQQVFKWLRIGSLVAPAVGEGLRWKNQPEEIAPQILKLYSGYYYPRGEFSFTWLAQGWLPFVATTLMTAIVPKISGIIRRL